MRVRLDFNSAYLDESNYLFAGQQLIDGKDWNIVRYMFSSSLPIYIIGLGNELNGLLGARFLNTVFGLVSLLFYFDAVRRLFKNNYKTAFLATLLLATSASHAFISKFAVYDIICVAFFIMGLWAVIIAEQSQNAKKYAWIIVSSVLFCIAILSKYIAFLMLLPIGLAVLIYRRNLFLLATLPAILLIFVYGFYYFDDLKVLYQQQVVKAHKANAQPSELFSIAYHYTWPLLLLFLVSLVHYHRQTKARDDKTGLIYEWSLVLALPMVIYHLFTGDSISMYKHMVYSIIFLAPVGALYLQYLFDNQHKIAPIVLGSFLIFWTLYNNQQLQAIEQAYPDSRQAVATLAKHIQRGDNILAEDPYLIRNEFKGIINPYAVSETAWYDNNGDGNYSSQDVIDGVWDGKFEFLYLDGRVTPITTEKLRKHIVKNKYRLIYQAPYTTSTVMFYKNKGVIEIYQHIKTP
jgi:4-amino-4-deoxy-L-arabinose transferase-like glycosyltransferase